MTLGNLETKVIFRSALYIVCRTVNTQYSAISTLLHCITLKYAHKSTLYRLHVNLTGFRFPSQRHNYRFVAGPYMKWDFVHTGKSSSICNLGNCIIRVKCH